MNDYSDYETMYHQTVAERVRLRQINAELLAALERIVKSLTLAGDPELACQEYQLGIARAALAKANKPHQSNDKEC